ncbi:MAG: ribonuclease domain-containing protein [Ruthenibacterium sp.]
MKGRNFAYYWKRYLFPLLILLALLWAAQWLQNTDTSPATIESKAEIVQTQGVTEGESYTEKNDVALYLVYYHTLPPNFITKKEAQALGWDSEDGNLDEIAPGKSIGGDVFGNYDGDLPTAKGRVWHECDLNYKGGYRGAQRLLYSSDDLIYYTDDHYETFHKINLTALQNAATPTK